MRLKRQGQQVEHSAFPTESSHFRGRPHKVYVNKIQLLFCAKLWNIKFEEQKLQTS